MESNAPNMPDTFDALNISNTTTNIERKKNQVECRKEQEIYQITIENEPGNAEILKAAGTTRDKR